MVGVGSGIVIRNMARVAIGRCAREPVRMALHAVHANVLAGQRERRRIVIEGGVRPRAFIVAPVSYTHLTLPTSDLV